jgi:hypothetical protein
MTRSLTNASTISRPRDLHTAAPDCTTLWVVDSGRNTASGFAVDGGIVTELRDSPTPGPAGAQPIGLVVT